MSKSMEDTPTPAVNGPSQRLVCQELQASPIHSGHLRAHDLQFSPYIPDIPSQEQTMPFHSRRGTANSHFPASDIEILIAPSTKSNTLHGKERIVFENAANMVRYHIWFVNPFVKPAENDSLLEGYWVKAATKLGWKDVEMGRAAMNFVCLLIYK